MLIESQQSSHLVDLVPYMLDPFDKEP